MEDHTVVSRAQLYERVWSEPSASVAIELGVSGVALGKICRKMGVPVPGRGYWARIKAGQTPHRIPLPPASNGQPESHEFSPGQHAGTARMAPDVIAKVQAEKTTADRIKVPETLRNPHPLVAASGPLLREALKKRGNRPVWSTRCLDIFVGTRSLNRALRVMDTLIKALEARGYPVEITKAGSEQDRRDPENASYSTGARISGFLITFGIDEDWDLVLRPTDPSRRTIHQKVFGHDPLPEYDRTPSGRLVLRLKSHTYGCNARRNWKDRGTHRIEEHLNTFIAAMMMEAERERVQKEERDRQQRESAERQARAERQQRLLADVKKRLSALEQTKLLRELAAVVETRADPDGATGEAGKLTREWIAWVRRVADYWEGEAVQGVAEAWINPRPSYLQP